MMGEELGEAEIDNRLGSSLASIEQSVSTNRRSTSVTRSSQNAPYALQSNSLTLAFGHLPIVAWKQRQECLVKESKVRHQKSLCVDQKPTQQPRKQFREQYAVCLALLLLGLLRTCSCLVVVGSSNPFGLKPVTNLRGLIFFRLMRNLAWFSCMARGGRTMCGRKGRYWNWALKNRAAVYWGSERKFSAERTR